MNIKHLVQVACFALVASAFSSCVNEALNVDIVKEKYTQSFIKQFGLIDPNQDWNMAKADNVTVNVGEHANSVKVYCKVNDKYYLVADLNDVTGSLNIPIDIPKNCNDLKVKIDGKSYFVKAGATVEVNNPMSRTILPETGGGTLTLSEYSVTTSRPTNPELFNTMQIAPIINPSPWDNYYSLNSGTYRYNNPLGNYLTEAETAAEIAAKEKGLIPEGHDNRGNSKISENFTISPGENGQFTIYPMFWNTARNHILGVYLIDDATGLPMTDSDGKYLRFPIFKDKEGDDLQKNTGTTSTGSSSTSDEWPTEQKEIWLNGIPSSLITKWPNAAAFFTDGVLDSDKFQSFADDVKELWDSENNADVLLYSDFSHRERYDLTHLNFDGEENRFSVKATFTPKPKPSGGGESGGATVDIPSKLVENPSGWSSITGGLQQAYGSTTAGVSASDEALMKSLGITVAIKNPDGTPYTGEVGMYIEFDDQASYGSATASQKTDKNLYNLDVNYGSDTEPRHPYIFYSQYTLNQHRIDYNDNTQTPHQDSYACSFKHPVSGRLFFSFEDWPIHATSDTDLNDLVFLLDDIEVVKGTITISSTPTPPEPEVDTMLSWLIAAEDLGSTDDFDFNDVVFKITSITYKAVGDAEPIKQVKVKALAAGGTLPVYLHYVNGENDYILGPKDVVAASTADESYEWHKWFGASIPHTAMINTGQRDISTTAEIDMTDYIDMSDFTVAEYSSSTAGKLKGFYLTVNGKNLMGDIGGTINVADNSTETKTIGAAATGDAPQMFLIKDEGKNESGSSSTWRWPKERVRIFDAYTSFGNWVGDANFDWLQDNPVSGTTCRPVQ